MNKPSRFFVGLAALVAVGLSSCVLPSDMRALQDNYDDLLSGVVTVPEFRAANAEVYATIDRRSAELQAEAGDIPTDPISLIAYLATLAATVGGSVVTTNRVRDKRRKLLHEPTIHDMKAPA